MQVASAVPGTAPVYLQVARYTTSGTTYFTAYTSPDGNTWTAVPGSTTALSLPQPLLAGFAITSHDQGTGSAVTLNNVSITSNEVPPPGLAACPSGWSCNDIGGPLPAGQDSLNNGTWSEVGGGADIWGTSDSFHLVSQSLSGDGTVSAQVTSQQATDPWAKAGVMMRGSTDPGSPYYAVFVTPGNGIDVQARASQGGTSVQVASEAGDRAGIPPSGQVHHERHHVLHRLHVPRRQHLDSRPGLDDGPEPAPTFAGRVRDHLPRPGHRLGGDAQQRVDHVQRSAASGPGRLPERMVLQRHRRALPAGQDSRQHGTWSEVGGGADIWGTSDSFHMVSQSLSGDGTVSVQVTSQQATDPWAKAGVMMRGSTDPGSPYYAVFVTPGNGIDVQARASQGGNSVQVASEPGTAPVYLQVARYTTSGTTYFTAYTSPDGTPGQPSRARRRP